MPNKLKMPMEAVDLLNDEALCDHKLCKIRDLITMSHVGGKPAREQQFQIISSIMSEEGMDEQYLDRAFSDPMSIRDAYPAAEEERMAYLAQLVLLMVCGGEFSEKGECSKPEMRFCEFVAGKLGFSGKFVGKVVASYTAEWKFQKDDR